MVKATIKGKREPMELEGGHDPWYHVSSMMHSEIQGRLSSVMLNFQFFREPWQEWRRRF